MLPVIFLIGQLTPWLCLVQNPKEAVLDSEFLSITSSYAAQQADKLSSAFVTIDVNVFIQKFRNAIKKTEIVEDDDNANFDWEKCSRLGQKFFKKRVNCPSFL